MNGRGGVRGVEEADEHDDQTLACSVMSGLKADFGVRGDFLAAYMG